MNAFTPAQAAKALGVGRSKLMGWIHSGQLAAFDVGESGVPRYRIDENAIREFQRRRGVKPAVKRQRTRRVTQQATRDYFPDL